MKRWVDPTTGRSRDEGRGGQRSGQGQLLGEGGGGPMHRPVAAGSR